MKNIHVIPVGTSGLTHILYKWGNQPFNICLKAFFSLKCSCYLSQPTYSALDLLWDLKKGVPSVVRYADKSFNQVLKEERLHLKDYHQVHCQQQLLSLSHFAQSDIIISVIQ